MLHRIDSSNDLVEIKLKSKPQIDDRMTRAMEYKLKRNQNVLKNQHKRKQREQQPLKKERIYMKAIWRDVFELRVCQCLYIMSVCVCGCRCVLCGCLCR